MSLVWLVGLVGAIGWGWAAWLLRKVAILKQRDAYRSARLAEIEAAEMVVYTPPNGARWCSSTSAPPSLSRVEIDA